MDFDWTTGSPLDEVPLSVRWEGTLFIPQSGTYALGTRSAGRSQVLLDGSLVVDNPGAVESPQASVEGARSLAKGWHGLVVICLDCAGGVMQLYWIPPDGEAGIVPADALSTVPLAEHGLRGYYYAGTEPGELPVFTQVDPILSFRWHDDPLPVPWCAHWEGKIRIQEGGEYRFGMYANDYAALYINGQQVVEYPSAPSGSIQLEVGEHEMLVKYSNTKYYSEMRLFWTPPGGSSSETIPMEVLFP
jgi:hypothetical protein